MWKENKLKQNKQLSYDWPREFQTSQRLGPRMSITCKKKLYNYSKTK